MNGVAAQRPSMGSLPDIITPDATSGATPESLCRWMDHEGVAIRSRLHCAGALLFRGFGFSELPDFENFTARFAGTLTTYLGGASKRTHVEGKVFTSTDTAAQFTINQHHEGAYMSQMPGIVGFFCREPAAVGGQTPLADSRRVLDRLPAELTACFERLGLQYINNLPNRFGLGKSWQAQFQTEKEEVVEEILRAEGYEFAWKADGSLRTTIRCPAIGIHPRTGERAWIAQADHWHPSGLETVVRARMAQVLPETEFPMNVTYGDGTEMEEKDLIAIRAAIHAETVQFDWQAGDVLICDNYLVSHGRRPYKGERKVFVALG